MRFEPVTSSRLAFSPTTTIATRHCQTTCAKACLATTALPKLPPQVDGTSNSIALGEGAGGALRKTSGEYGPWGMTGTHTCCHGRVVSTITNGAVTPTALEAQEWSINGRWTADTNVPKRTYAWVFNSLHTGGAQFAMGDGSVRFLSQTMDYASFAKLAYVHDGGVASNLD